MKTLDPLDDELPEEAPRAASTAETPLEAGDLVEHYRLLRRLGSGSMAEVFLARDTHLGRKVALKLIHRRLLSSSRSAEQLVAEARTTAQFNHPNIVAIYAVGQARGRPYLALEYIEGETLNARLAAERPSTKGALRMARAIAAALVEAHSRQVQHRDLKPDNVLIGRDGELRVVDFGIAKSLAATTTMVESVSATLPQPGRADELDGFGADGTERGLKGTPAYMAPEQWRQEPTTTATDVWALGVMLHEMLSGEHPYDAHALPPRSLSSFTALAMRVGSAEAAPRLEVGKERTGALVTLVADCLRKDPAERPTASELLSRLQGELEGHEVGAEVSERCPFPGLEPFSAQRQRFFVGRERELDAALERLRDAPVLPLVGPSGAGKSSFLRAGLLPRLREERHWAVLALRPGARPFAALARRLLSSEGYRVEGPTLPPRERSAELGEALEAQPLRLGLELARLAEAQQVPVLLVVDQTEELFTHDCSAETVEAFFSALLGAADEAQEPVRVVFSLREDFLHRLPASLALRDALGQLLVLGPPSRSALESILRRPVALAGYRYDDPSLVEEMLEVAGTAATSLPLLSFAVRELWQRRDVDARLLRRSDYEAIGGLDGALARHADGVLESMAPAQQELARALLLRLVSADRTRLVTSRERLLEGLDDEAVAVLQRLVEARLLSVRRGDQGEGDAVELSHEALLSRWQRLRGWIERSHHDLRQLAELRDAAALWARRGAVPTEVWRGRQLELAQGCLRRWPDARSGEVGEFVTLAEELEARARRRRKLLVFGASSTALLVVLVSLLVALAFARRQRATEQARRRAETQRRLAVVQRARAEREAAQAAWARGDHVLARALLRSSLEARDSPAGRALLWRLDRQPLRWRRSLGAFLYDVALDPSGRSVAVACQDGGVYLLERRSGQLQRVFRDHRDQVFSVAFSADGGRLAAGAWNGRVRIWRVSDGRQLLAFEAHKGAVWDLAFSADGALLYTAGADGSIAVVDTTTGKSRRRLRGHQGAVSRLLLAAKGKRLFSAGYDGTVRLWSLPEGRPLQTLAAHPKRLAAALALDASGSRLATGGFDGRVVLFRREAQRWRRERAFMAHHGGVLNVVFGPRGVLLSSGLDPAIRLWDSVSGASRGALEGHSGPVDALEFDARRREVVSAGRDRTARLWRLGGGATEGLRRHVAHEGAVYSVAFGPHGKRIASASTDGAVRFWDLSGAGGRPLRGHLGQVYAVAFGPEGRLLASAGRDRTIRLWRLPERRQEQLLVAHRQTVRSLDVAKGGKLLASSSEDGTVRLWRVGDGALLHTLRDHGTRVHVVRFAPDGALLASGGWDAKVRLWGAGGKRRGVLSGHRGTIRALAWREDGQVLYSAGDDGSVRAWSRRGGALRVLFRQAGLRIYALAAAGPGRLAFGGSDGVLRTVAIKGGEVRVVGRHGGEINDVVFRGGAGEALLASAGDDHTVRLWDLSQGRSRWRPPRLLAADDSLLLRAQGRWRAYGGALPPRGAGWLRAAERASAVDVRGAGLCLWRRQGAAGALVERWDRRSDVRPSSLQAPSTTSPSARPSRVRTWSQVLPHREVRSLRAAAEGSCVALVKDELLVLNSGGKRRVLLERASSLAADAEGLLAVGSKAAGTPARLLAFDPRSLAPRDFGRAPAGLTAFMRTPSLRVLGFRDGNLEFYDRHSGRRLQRRFEAVPAAAVRSLVQGPQGTLVVGYGRGELRVWHLHESRPLAEARLHGPIWRLLRRGRWLIATSELGQHRVLDLGIFEISYPRLLKRLRRASPLVWRGGMLRGEADSLRVETKQRAIP